MADHFVDIVENGLDLLVRIGNRLDSSMIRHRNGTTRRVTVATTGYFEQAGEPKKPDDLVDRDCIVYTHLATGNEWHFQGTDGTIKVRVGGCFQTNSSVAIRAAVLSGLGIAVAPVWMFGDQIYRGDLKVVLQDYQPTPLQIHGVYRRSGFYRAKIVCFIEFLAAEFKLAPWVSDYGV